MVTENPFNEALSENQDKGQLSLFVNYNPDVLNCLANLSSDEVFTPPNIANRMLDLLPKELWSNKDATFLDPFCKSGVFLREIVLRLNEGLKSQIPTEQERFNHILTKQVFGLGITLLTALISRRTLYCSKQANGKLSACTAFNDENGNIFYQRLEHRWGNNGKCEECGASRAEYDIISENRENHAYAFIHGNPLALLESRFKELGKEMKFDVIIGNPPYQMSDGGGTGSSARPLYHLFIQQAKKLNPEYLLMITPSRWFAGGKGLDEFRDEMLEDDRLNVIVDYIDSNDCFPGVDISGGISYFLWDKHYHGDCIVRTIENNKCTSEMKRPLKEEGSNVFIRFNQAISIVRKVKKYNEKSFSDLVFSRKPFGLASSYKGTKRDEKHNIELHSSKGISYITESEILNNKLLVNEFKVYIAKAYGERISSNFWVLGKPFLGKPNTACTETYLAIGKFDSETTCENVMSYIRTRFFRFLVLLKKNTQNSSKSTYELVPMQDFSKPWTDEELYVKYKLNKKEIAFIEKMVRPMDAEQD